MTSEHNEHGAGRKKRIIHRRGGVVDAEHGDRASEAVLARLSGPGVSGDRRDGPGGPGGRRAAYVVAAMLDYLTGRPATGDPHKARRVPHCVPDVPDKGGKVASGGNKGGCSSPCRTRSAADPQAEGQGGGKSPAVRGKGGDMIVARFPSCLAVAVAACLLPWPWLLAVAASVTLAAAFREGGVSPLWGRADTYNHSLSHVSGFFNP